MSDRSAATASSSLLVLGPPRRRRASASRRSRPCSGSTCSGGVELVYQGRPSAAQPKVTQDALDRAVDIMRKRVDQLGVAEPEIQRSGRDQISVALPGVTNAAPRAASRSARRPSSPSTTGRPACSARTTSPWPRAWPTATRTTSRSRARRAIRSAGPVALRRGQAGGQAPADQRRQQLPPGPAVLARSTKGTHALPAPGPTTRRPTCAPTRRPPARRGGNEVVTIQPGTLILPGRPTRDKATRRPTGPDLARWYVLNDNPALLGKDIKDPQQDFDNGAGGGDSPVVTFKFTEDGRRRSSRTSRKTIAQRGAGIAAAGPSADERRPALRDRARPQADLRRHDRPAASTRTASTAPTARRSRATSRSSRPRTSRNLIKLGALPINLKLISQSKVSATLGKQALHQGLDRRRRRPARSSSSSCSSSTACSA